MSRGFGIDPEKDIAGRIEDECFLCGKPIAAPNLMFWGPPGAMSVRLPVHATCMNGRALDNVAKEYHRRIHDLADVKRVV